MGNLGGFRRVNPAASLKRDPSAGESPIHRHRFRRVNPAASLKRPERGYLVLGCASFRRVNPAASLKPATR